MLAPLDSNSFMISSEPDSAQSCSAVLPLTDLRFTSAPMSIRYLDHEKNACELNKKERLHFSKEKNLIFF